LLIEAEQCHKSVELQTLVFRQQRLTQNRMPVEGNCSGVQAARVISNIGRWPTGQGQLYVRTVG